MGGMGGVLHDTGSFTGASCKKNIQDGGERGTDDFSSCAAKPTTLAFLIFCILSICFLFVYYTINKSKKGLLALACSIFFSILSVFFLFII